MAFRTILCISAIVFSGLCHESCSAQEATRSWEYMKVSVQAEKPGANGKQPMTITIELDKDVWIYAHDVDNEDFDSAKLSVRFEAGGKPVPAEIRYPASKRREVEFIGSFRTHEGKVVISASVERDREPKAPLEVTLRVHGFLEPPRGY